MRVVSFLTAAAFLSCSCLAWSEEAPKSDPAKLVGTWNIVSGEDQGQAIPEDHIKGTTVRITKDTITVLDRKDQQTYVVNYKLDPAKKPWTVTMMILDGPMKGKATSGILELSGDDLKLCYALPGEKAPADFKVPAGSKQLLLVMKRARAGAEK